MAVKDIPEFVEVAPGDLIRAENWNNMQQQVRDSLRRHQHTRAPNAPVNDAATIDEADQINTNEIADGAVTSAKLASNAISGANIPDAAITTQKLADAAVTTAKLADASVSTAKLGTSVVTSSRIAFSTVASGQAIVPPGSTSDGQVVAGGKGGGQTAATVLYFPLMTITSTDGTGVADVQADIIYRQAPGSTAVSVFIRLKNVGSATAHVTWQVMTFAN